MEKYLEVLQKCPLFEGVHPTELVGLLDCLGGRQVQAAKEQTVLLEGEPAVYVGIVLEGAVRLERQDYYGNRSILGKVLPSEIFAEAFAML